MDAQRFETLAAAIERDRRVDFWVSLVMMLLAVGMLIYLRLINANVEREHLELLRGALTANDSFAAGSVQQVINMSALSTSLTFSCIVLMVLIPWALGRFRWRQDRALVELLRAQSKLQASSR